MHMCIKVSVRGSSMFIFQHIKRKGQKWYSYHWHNIKLELESVHLWHFWMIPNYFYKILLTSKHCRESLRFILDHRNTTAPLPRQKTHSVSGMKQQELAGCSAVTRVLVKPHIPQLLPHNSQQQPYTSMLNSVKVMDIADFSEPSSTEY